MLKRFEVLDALRGICALFVLLFHTRLNGAISEASFFRNSFVFVDFFFILSGFVLAHGYAFKENVNFKNYMTSRFWRIYPLHFALFMVFLIFEIGKYLAFTYQNISISTVPFTGSGALKEIIPNLLLIQSWYSGFRSDSFNGVSWSISIEFYMYIIFICTVLLAKSYKILVWIIISSSMFYCLITNNYIFNGEVLHGLSCFFLGTLLYVLRRKIPVIHSNYWLITLLELVVCYLIFISVGTSLVFSPVVVPFVFAIAVFLFSFEKGACSNVLSNKYFQYIGLLSYSIYMTHSVILFILKSTLILLHNRFNINLYSISEATFLMNFGNSFINNISILFIIFFTVVLSHYTYTYIELRFKKKKVS